MIDQFMRNKSLNGRHRLFDPKRRHVHTIAHLDFVTSGLEQPFWQDLYHHLLTIRWPAFISLVASAFLAINALFAAAYLFGQHSIVDESPKGFLGAFFFSVETLATVGYGAMHPNTVYGHVIVTIEVFVGMTGTALITGLVFARFSRPHAKLLFARTAVVRPIDGVQTLMIRVANARLNVISEASAQLRLMRIESGPEGEQVREFHDLALMRSHHPVFVLGWNLMHRIDASSPLFNQSAESMASSDSLLILSIDGVDENTEQFMRSRHVYSAGDIRWQHRYPQLIQVDEGGVHRIDYDKFHDVEPV
ncbi:inward rectifier potassium channel [Burkholderia sp. WP9]|uniref:ion channel n=1 Tax=Burkholderia sp. WP9 TaxID=1500263 RepID=UPI00089AA9E1|nr:ion channel [Burkholderia sp. WP9]SEF13478.1 inward rectifier potassium channel [Burkholderia sp. WP9]